MLQIPTGWKMDCGVTIPQWGILPLSLAKCMCPLHKRKKKWRQIVIQNFLSQRFTFELSLISVIQCSITLNLPRPATAVAEKHNYPSPITTGCPKVQSITLAPINYTVWCYLGGGGTFDETKMQNWTYGEKSLHELRETDTGSLQPQAHPRDLLTMLHVNH